jgi:regulator of sigma E protease
VKYFHEIQQAIYLDEADRDVKLSVERGGMPLTITVPRARIPEPDKEGMIIPAPAQQVVSVGGVVKGSPAEKAEMKPSDVIVSADGERIGSVLQFQKHISANAGHPIAIEIRRDGGTLVRNVTPTSEGKIGVEISDDYQGPRAKVDYGMFEALSAGWKEMTSVTAGTFGLVGRLFTGGAKLKDSVGGPLMIAKTAREYAARGIPDFLSLMGVLSVTLACMNILPIPALDGGHLVFILIEGVTRREVPLKVRMAVQQVGFALLIIFMAFVIYNDTTR